MKIILLMALLSLSVYAKECDGAARRYSDCKDLVTTEGNTCCLFQILDEYALSSWYIPFSDEELNDLKSIKKEVEEDLANEGMDAIVTINCNDTEKETKYCGGAARSYSKCKYLDTREGYTCCFYEAIGKNFSSSYCSPFKNKELKDLESVKKEAEENLAKEFGQEVTVTIDCKGTDENTEKSKYCDNYFGRSYSECKDLDTTEGNTCCLFQAEYKSKKYSWCVSISDEELKDLESGNVKEDLEKEFGLEYMTIDCKGTDISSNYLSKFLFILLSLLF